MTHPPTRGNQPDLVEVIGDAIFNYYDGFGQHPGVTRAYGAAEAVVAALGRRRPDLKALLNGAAVQEWTWRHNRYVGVEQAVHDGVIRDRSEAVRNAATCRTANPGDDVGVVTRFVSAWVEEGAAALTVPSLDAGSGVGGQRDTSTNPTGEE